MLRRVVPSTQVKLTWALVNPPQKKFGRAKAVTEGEAKVIDVSFEGAFLVTCRAELVMPKSKLSIHHGTDACHAIVRRVAAINDPQTSAWGVTFHDFSPGFWVFLNELLSTGYLIPDTPIQH